LESFTVEQLNTVPKGFSNNIIWNISHIMATQQILVFKLSGLPLLVSQEIEDTYKNGSVPTEKSTREEVHMLKELLILAVKKTKEDFNKQNFFRNY
jgi:hypothetical protein